MTSNILRCFVAVAALLVLSAVVGCARQVRVSDEQAVSSASVSFVDALIGDDLSKAQAMAPGTTASQVASMSQDVFNGQAPSRFKVERVSLVHFTPVDPALATGGGTAAETQRRVGRSFEVNLVLSGGDTGGQGNQVSVSGRLLPDGSVEIREAAAGPFVP